MNTEVTYRVVRNDEDQYSVWQVGQAVPAGWADTGFEGTKDECLDHIAAVWTDMRPASLRRWMEKTAPGSSDHERD